MGALVDGLCVLVVAGTATYAAMRFGVERVQSLAPFAGVLAYAIVNAYFIQMSGQTLGKKFAMTRMVLRDGTQAPLWRVVVLRWLVLSIGAAFVPFVSIVDVVLIFIGSEKRCLHDYLAGTYVITVSRRAPSR